MQFSMAVKRTFRTFVKMECLVGCIQEPVQRHLHTQRAINPRARAEGLRAASAKQAENDAKQHLTSASCAGAFAIIFEATTHSCLANVLQLTCDSILENDSHLQSTHEMKGWAW